jgi:DNA-binding winged helix-turn-helix (wHTH) protein/phosphohistidine phosphatase SixA
MENELKIDHLVISFNDYSIKSNGVEVSLDKKAFEVLELMMKNDQQTVSIDAFMDSIWTNKPSSPEVVTSAIARLRKVFKMTGIGDDLITTVHKIGYRFETPTEITKPEATKSDNRLSENIKPDLSKTSVFNYKKLFYLLLLTVLFSSIGLLMLQNKSKSLPANSKQTEFSSILKESNSDMTQIYILRHTEKSDTVTEDPPLSEAGIERAHYLKKVLQYIEFDRIFTTDYVRNIQTSNILVGDKNIKPEIYYPMSFEVLEFIKSIQGQKILIIGHSNTIPDMVNRIIGESTYPPMSHKNYNLMHIVNISKDGETSSSVVHIDMAKN